MIKPQNKDGFQKGEIIMQKTLYNCYSDNCCGYCKLHQCSITVKQLKKKECLKKQCWYLEKNEEHDYWRQRERTKELRKESKLALAGLA